jgi:rhamnogalacturonyl hydrolase YesR
MGFVELVENSFKKLENYCSSEDYKGWDPYDGLNSKLFRAIPVIKNNKLAQLAWIQSFKRCPLNLRKLVLIEKDYNPKGLALFLAGYCNLYKTEQNQRYLQKINNLVKKIISLKTGGYSGACWGYNFDWQSRAFYQPKYFPTIVASVYIGYSLLDSYEITGNKDILKLALSIADFILNDLNKTYDKDGNYVFSYSPSDKTEVFNASLLGSRLLSRLFHYSGNENLIHAAKKSVEFCCKNQKNDGSWTYSTLPFHQWIDSFHTGFNIECIHEYQKYSNDRSYASHLEKGLKYYLDTFFTDEGKSKYYNNSLYPIDIHAPAQLIITLSRLGILQNNIDLANKVLKWTIDNMQSLKGYFYYQVKKRYKIRIPYMRWSQAWMFYALTEYLSNIS